MDGKRSDIDSRNAAFRFLVPAFLLAALFAVYFPVLGHPFLLLDDEAYLTANPIVRQGLTLRGTAWAFSTFHAGNWHPLTWISHMADVSLFGMAPGAHHAVNVLFHAANTLLLFGFLARSTGDRMRSAFVAALFAVHPLHVESVAWVAERKDLLCAFFFFLALHAYRRHAAQPSAMRAIPVAILHALSLMAKPMTLTLPFVLLLLDFWPLERTGAGTDGATRRGHSAVRLLAEKIPLFALSAASAVLTIAAQGSWGFTNQGIPIAQRVSNALLSYVGYLAKTAWPAGLSVYYPHPAAAGGIPLWQSAAAAAVLAAISFLALRRPRTRPSPAVGWLWYLVMLVPVIGLVQAGSQAMADRYTYLPLVGIFILVAWGIPADLLNSGIARRMIPAAGAASVVAFSLLSVQQVAAWKSDETLFRKALEANPRNHFAIDGLGTLRSKEGRFREAENLFREAIRISPGAQMPRTNLAAVLIRQGRLDEGLAEAQAALEISPGLPFARMTFASALYESGRLAEAVPHFEAAILGNPANLEARLALGACLAGLGRVKEAELRFLEVLRYDPANAHAFNNLGVLLEQAGRPVEAAERFRQALRADPGNGFALRRLEELGFPAR